MSKLILLLIVSTLNGMKDKKPEIPADYTCEEIVAQICDEKGNKPYECVQPIKVLGQGSFGTVFLVALKADQKQLAMKVHIIESNDLAERTEESEGSDTEYSYLKSNKNPNVATAMHRRAFTNGFATILELLDGGDLFTDLADNFNANYGVKNPKNVLQVFGSVVDGINYLHGRKLVHRDIKPENIGRGGNVWKVFDLGLSIKENTEHYPSGTEEYLDPIAMEKYMRKPSRKHLTTRKTDVYALGVMLYEMTYDRFPYQNAPKKGKEQWYDACKHKPIKYDAGTDATVAELIHGMLQYKEEDRITLPEVLEKIAKAEPGKVTLKNDLHLSNEQPMALKDKDVNKKRVLRALSTVTKGSNPDRFSPVIAGINLAHHNRLI
jgi:serine/threonine protein kinase